MQTNQQPAAGILHDFWYIFHRCYTNRCHQQALAPSDFSIQNLLKNYQYVICKFLAFTNKFTDCFFMCSHLDTDYVCKFVKNKIK